MAGLSRTAYLRGYAKTNRIAGGQDEGLSATLRSGGVDVQRKDVLAELCEG